MNYNPHVALTLIIIGAIILAVIFVLHKPGKKKPEHASRRTQTASGRTEPTLGPGSSPDESAGDVEVPEMGGEVRQEPLLPELEPAPEEEKDEPDDAPDEVVFPDSPEDEGGEQKIVTLYLRVRSGRKITGVHLLDAALKAGLEFGEMNIFHRRHEGGERAVFSMANLLKPGDFDPTAWNLFESPGLTLFMSLPGPVSALDGWDAMLATGQRLAELLDVELLDDAQCQISRQRIAQMREEMREYDRKTGL